MSFCFSWCKRDRFTLESHDVEGGIAKSPRRPLPGILTRQRRNGRCGIELNFGFMYLGRSHFDSFHMQRLLRIFIGPELYWIILYLLVTWLAGRNLPPTATGNSSLEWTVWLTATVGVVLSFAFLAVPGVNRRILLMRLALAGFIGVNACAITACEAIKYLEPGRDAGLMALWFLAAMVGGFVWCVSAGVSLLILRVKSKHS